MVNPYGRLAWAEAPFAWTPDADGQLALSPSDGFWFIRTPSIKDVGSMQSFQAIFRVLGDARLLKEKPFVGTEQAILTQIHTARFDVTKPYVISAGHFSELYTRNLGIFYNAILDPRFALSQEDWETRQQITASTLALHLGIVQRAGKEYTTIYPIWGNIYTGVNVYDEPSDSLFAALYTLRAMTDETFISNIFPAATTTKYTLATKKIGAEMQAQYGPVLERVTNDYLTRIIDPTTGLIRKDILLSSARDQIKRQSSFYDNVIAWSTAKHAVELGLHIYCPTTLQKEEGDEGACDFELWKQKIIAAFWDDTTGIFLDDLSERSKQEHVYSGDAFIVTSTQFLDFENTEDREKIMREIAYVQHQGMDKPFPLRYAVKDQHDLLNLPVRSCMPSYMGETIWSHWGMEYVKTLILLIPYHSEYRTDVQRALDAYRHNIETYGGYPELYDKEGIPYHTWCYQSLLHTGWVVGYEQARMMWESLHQAQQ